MVTKTLSIRAGTSGDLPVLNEIRAAAFAPIFASFRAILGDALYDLAQRHEDEGQADLLASLFEAGSEWRVHVAEFAGEIVGFCSVRMNPETHIGEIGLNAVHPGHAGRGVGTAMYEFAVATMRKAGMRAAAVSTGGDPSHAAARRAYEKAGFNAAVPSQWMCRLL